MNKELLEGIRNEDFFPKFFKFVFEKMDEIKKEKQVIDFIKDNWLSIKRANPKL